MLDNVVFVTDGVLEGVARFLTSPGGDSELHNLAEFLSHFPYRGRLLLKKPFCRPSIFSPVLKNQDSGLRQGA